MTVPGDRPLRVDAQRNRDLLLASAVLLVSAIDTLLEASVVAGVLRADVKADDVLISLSGVALAAGSPAQRDQAGRLLDLLMDGLRYRP